MAYACPVCDTIEADAEHLANHLAVTASLHEADHAAWLDDHVPDWPDRSPAELGADVIDHAEQRPIGSDTHGHEHAGDATTPRPPGNATGRDGRPDVDVRRDPETERILREARELTERASEDAETRE